MTTNASEGEVSQEFKNKYEYFYDFETSKFKELSDNQVFDYIKYPDALTLDNLGQRFRKLSRKTHPDKGKSKTEKDILTKIFQRVSDAKDNLEKRLSKKTISHPSTNFEVNFQELKEKTKQNKKALIEHFVLHARCLLEEIPELAQKLAQKLSDDFLQDYEAFISDCLEPFEKQWSFKKNSSLYFEVGPDDTTYEIERFGQWLKEYFEFKRRSYSLCLDMKPIAGHKQRQIKLLGNIFELKNNPSNFFQQAVSENIKARNINAKPPEITEFSIDEMRNDPTFEKLRKWYEPIKQYLDQYSSAESNSLIEQDSSQLGEAMDDVIKQLTSCKILKISKDEKIKMLTDVRECFVHASPKDKIFYFKLFIDIARSHRTSENFSWKNMFYHEKGSETQSIVD